MDARSKSDQTSAKDQQFSDIATDVLNDVATLLQTELRLLRTEISEKLTMSALSAALLGAGVLLLMTTIVLLLQAAIAALVAFGFSWPAASLIVAAVTLVLGAILVWFGIQGLGAKGFVPTKVVQQLNKDAKLANITES